MKPILVSGIQPTGKLHLGNYLGALKNFVALQDSGKYSCFFFIADLHALTENPDPKKLNEGVLNLTIDFLTAGINPKKSIIFLQSEIPAHSELTWILNTITPLGELKRMIQFKFKARAIWEYLDKKHQDEKNYTGQVSDEFANKLVEENIEANANAGLVDYPILMASDILLYSTKFVPVGEDQDQHLELTRTLARKFNNKFGRTFIEPQGLHTKVPRLMSLDDATKKMSKSRPAGCLFLDDSPEIVRKKIKRAQTDSGREIKYDPKNKAAVSNLISIYAGLTEKPIGEIERKFKNSNYAGFKKDLAEVIVKALKPFRENKLSKNAAEKILRAGTKKANVVAAEKLLEIKKKIGLIF
ncbi:MAG: Tryptophan-tRNA ligase [Candidatus Jorgensenbacteria bacterium GW2011_GWA1_48_11]|uniref:Tryptophan--tRNA ligase n=1 Tax=Candidatus Jorgensenbacteria bacterium GW2011_GWA1_48_11 TaxID=1618660 RepID=A0A0G1UBJ1_9BACT|nr:MAG: Tryptophan-tRNA ligase [Candidatus Jorgensenbacteria bacterium GW2011_GWA1_48_11]KKW12024.1 MAG: Tryptophan-tRNA ligase [Candidatus Jorgensenbacteria bacterium GW2011_GWB1_49_9]